MPARSSIRSPFKSPAHLALYFYALKDGLRLDMIVLLAGRRECTVNEMAAMLGKSQPLVSWHLRRLKSAELVKIRRAGREVYCSLNREVIAQRQREFADLLNL